jgi:hypothetical protein
MWEPRCLTTLWVSTTSCRNSFILPFPLTLVYTVPYLRLRPTDTSTRHNPPPPTPTQNPCKSHLKNSDRMSRKTRHIRGTHCGDCDAVHTGTEIVAYLHGFLNNREGVGSSFPTHVTSPNTVSSHPVSMTTLYRLMLFREISAVHHTEHINALCGQNA